MFLFCIQVKLMNLLIRQEINHPGNYEVKLFIDLKLLYGLVIGSFINKTYLFYLFSFSFISVFDCLNLINKKKTFSIFLLYLNFYNSSNQYNPITIINYNFVIITKKI
jgi:hypothetical protein